MKQLKTETRKLKNGGLDKVVVIGNFYWVVTKKRQKNVLSKS